MRNDSCMELSRDRQRQRHRVRDREKQIKRGMLGREKTASAGGEPFPSLLPLSLPASSDGRINNPLTYSLPPEESTTPSLTHSLLKNQQPPHSLPLPCFTPRCYLVLQTKAAEEVTLRRCVPSPPGMYDGISW